jgi:hypothetical protein
MCRGIILYQNDKNKIFISDRNPAQFFLFNIMIHSSPAYSRKKKPAHFEQQSAKRPQMNKDPVNIQQLLQKPLAYH